MVGSEAAVLLVVVSAVQDPPRATELQHHPPPATAPHPHLTGHHPDPPAATEPPVPADLAVDSAVDSAVVSEEAPSPAHTEHPADHPPRTEPRATVVVSEAHLALTEPQVQDLEGQALGSDQNHRLVTARHLLANPPRRTVHQNLRVVTGPLTVSGVDLVANHRRVMVPHPGHRPLMVLHRLSHRLGVGSVAVSHHRATVHQNLRLLTAHHQLLMGHRRLEVLVSVDQVSAVGSHLLATVLLLDPRRVTGRLQVGLEVVSVVVDPHRRMGLHLLVVMGLLLSPRRRTVHRPRLTAHLAAVGSSTRAMVDTYTKSLLM